MAQSRTRCLGMEVPKESIAVASVAQAPGAAVTSLGPIGLRQGALAPLLRHRPAQATHVLLLSDAGPWGSWLSRSCTPQGYPCGVGAPSLMPPKAGARVNTARRVAGPLARRARSGARTAVSVPKVAEAAMRDRTRAREATRSALKDATGRLNAFGLRPDLQYTGRATGTPRKSVDRCHCDGRTTRNASRTAAGKPQSGWAHAPAALWHAANTPPGAPGPWPVSSLGFGGPWPRRGQAPRRPTDQSPVPPQRSRGAHVPRLLRRPGGVEPAAA